MMHYHYTKNTNNGAERLSHYPAYTKMMAPQAHVIQNHVADHSCNDDVAAASRDDEETVAVATAANTLAEWRGNKVPEKEAKALRHVFDDLEDHFGYQRVDPRVRFNSPNLARLCNSGTWFGDLDFTYYVNGEHCNLAYIGIDVCVDLSHPSSSTSMVSRC